MDFKEICKARYSVRAYKPDTIPAEKMDYIKECTRLAPSQSTSSHGNSSSSPAKTTAHACSNATTRNGSARLRLISWSAKTTGGLDTAGMTRKTNAGHRRGHRP